MQVLRFSHRRVSISKEFTNNYINKYSYVANYRLDVVRLFYTVCHRNIYIPLIFDFARLMLIYNINFEVLFNENV